MRNNLPFRLVVVVFGLALIGASCSKDNNSHSAAKPGDTTTTTIAPGVPPTFTTTVAGPTILDVEAADPDFSTFVSLVRAAGLADTLSGPGPYTLFAPTNSAFANLAPATLQQLRADPKGALANLIKLHIVRGKFSQTGIIAAAGTCVLTLRGKVKLKKVPQINIDIGGAQIINFDTQASNGVIDNIGDVITAPSPDC